MKRPLVLPVLLFLVLLAHGATLGLTDDEAYYWVLSQRPALGYAFHPPMVAWIIGLFDFSIGKTLGLSPIVVRLPAALLAALVLALAIRWLRRAGTPERELPAAGLVVAAFAGLFGMSWMMVPDLPLLLGWMLAFGATWDLCEGRGPLLPPAAALGAGVALATLSKYSGVLIAVSSIWALWAWAAPRPRRAGALAVGAGLVLALVPILLWNARHEWASLIYQFRDRHASTGLSWPRYGRFWLIQLALAGPPLLLHACGSLARMAKGKLDRSALYAWIWAAPAALAYCLQPLWAEFKPHWALIVWFPLVLGLARQRARAPAWLLRAHLSYGALLFALIIVVCQLPVISWTVREMTGSDADPRWDVSNDMTGWDALEAEIETLPAEYRNLPIVGSRYQTASQAAFALGDAGAVTLLPRDLKQRDEWPDLAVSETEGPGWPRLRAPVLFVADNRYSAGPEFTGAECSILRKIERKRYGFSAKTIDLWRCEPVDLLPESM
jgi:4-amino-4-deoxy-L-arabinose transferase-like glycosyltransferase